MRPALEEEQAQETVDMAVAPGPERSTLTVAGPSASALGESRGGAPSRRREAAQHPFEFDQVGRSRALRSGWEGGRGEGVGGTAGGRSASVGSGSTHEQRVTQGRSGRSAERRGLTGLAGVDPGGAGRGQVFDSGASQEAVFGAVEELVQSALDGYRVCIFAYGQARSGEKGGGRGGDSVSTLAGRHAFAPVSPALSLIFFLVRHRTREALLPRLLPPSPPARRRRQGAARRTPWRAAPSRPAPPAAASSPAPSSRQPPTRSKRERKGGRKMPENPVPRVARGARGRSLPVLSEARAAPAPCCPPLPAAGPR